MNKPKAKDEADIASEQEELARQEAMWNMRRKATLKHRGTCHNCGESSQSPFCDVDCRRDYERAQKVRQHQHGER